jgi:hypothetical protein
LESIQISVHSAYVNNYILLSQEREHVPISRFLGPLLEYAFVAAARESIPPARQRVTTASTRGSLRGGRGRGRSAARSVPTQGNNNKGRGKGKKRQRTATDIQDDDAQEVPVTKNGPPPEDI